MTYIELPENRGSGRPCKYPLGEMLPGEERFFAGVPVPLLSKRYSSHRPKQFRTKAVEINGVPGAMVTRVDNTDIPLRIGRAPIHPFREMSVGETVFIPNRTTKSLVGCVKHMKDRKYKFRQVVSGGVFGTRVWRLA